MNPIARALDRLLAVLKWPVAVAALIFLPGLAYALFFVIRGVSQAPKQCLPFLVGIGLYLLFWVLVVHRRPSRIGFWATLEHELTHALFALATFHRVVALRATLRSGGHIRYLGRGNWLIAVAPYFFPTASLLVIAGLTWLPGQHLELGGALLGVTVAYHVLSNWSETHRHQSDLREVGGLFALLFLPAANALVAGLLVSYACGLRSVTAHLAHVKGPSLVFFRWLVRVVVPG